MEYRFEQYHDVRRAQSLTGGGEKESCREKWTVWKIDEGVWSHQGKGLWEEGGGGGGGGFAPLE